MSGTDWFALGAFVGWVIGYGYPEIVWRAIQKVRRNRA